MKYDYQKLLKKQYKNGKFLIKNVSHLNSAFSNKYDVFYCGKKIATFGTNSIMHNGETSYHSVLALNTDHKPTVQIAFIIYKTQIRLNYLQIIDLKVISQFFFTKKVLIEKIDKSSLITYVTFSSQERLNDYLTTF